MTKISCTVSNCYYNKGNGCSANGIKVCGEDAKKSGSTCCDTFSDEKAGFTSSTNEPNNQSTVKCSACHCVHYNNDLCKATDINVNGKNADCCDATCCSTFICKK